MDKIGVLQSTAPNMHSTVRTLGRKRFFICYSAFFSFNRISSSMSSAMAILTIISNDGV